MAHLVSESQDVQFWVDYYHIWHTWALARYDVSRAIEFDLDLFIHLSIYNKAAKICHILQCLLHSMYSSGWILFIFFKWYFRQWGYSRSEAVRNRSSYTYILINTRLRSTSEDGLNVLFMRMSCCKGDIFCVVVLEYRWHDAQQYCSMMPCRWQRSHNVSLKYIRSKSSLLYITAVMITPVVLINALYSYQLWSCPHTYIHTYISSRKQYYTMGYWRDMHVSCNNHYCVVNKIDLHTLPILLQPAHKLPWNCL